jgi:hypothetical protein
MYIFNVRERIVHDPESFKRGYQLLDEYLACAYQRKREGVRRNPSA